MSDSRINFSLAHKTSDQTQKHRANDRLDATALANGECCVSPNDAQAIHDMLFRLRQLELTNELLQQEIDKMDREQLDLMLNLKDKQIQLVDLQNALQRHGIAIDDLNGEVSVNFSLPQSSVTVKEEKIIATKQDSLPVIDCVSYSNSENVLMATLEVDDVTETLNRRNQVMHGKPESTCSTCLPSESGIYERAFSECNSHSNFIDGECADLCQRLGEYNEQRGLCRSVSCQVDETQGLQLSDAQCIKSLETKNADLQLKLLQLRSNEACLNSAIKRISDAVLTVDAGAADSSDNDGILSPEMAADNADKIIGENNRLRTQLKDLMEEREGLESERIQSEKIQKLESECDTLRQELEKLHNNVVSHDVESLESEICQLKLTLQQLNNNAAGSTAAMRRITAAVLTNETETETVLNGTDQTELSTERVAEKVEQTVDENKRLRVQLNGLEIRLAEVEANETFDLLKEKYHRLEMECGTVKLDLNKQHDELSEKIETLERENHGLNLNISQIEGNNACLTASLKRISLAVLPADEAQDNSMSDVTSLAERIADLVEETADENVRLRQRLNDLESTPPGSQGQETGSFVKCNSLGLTVKDARDTGTMSSAASNKSLPAIVINDARPTVTCGTVERAEQRSETAQELLNGTEDIVVNTTAVSKEFEQRSEKSPDHLELAFDTTKGELTNDGRRMSDGGENETELDGDLNATTPCGRVWVQDNSARSTVVLSFVNDGSGRDYDDDDQVHGFLSSFEMAVDDFRFPVVTSSMLTSPTTEFGSNQQANDATSGGLSKNEVDLSILALDNASKFTEDVAIQTEIELNDVQIQTTPVHNQRDVSSDVDERDQQVVDKAELKSLSDEKQRLVDELRGLLEEIERTKITLNEKQNESRTETLIMELSSNERLQEVEILQMNLSKSLAEQKKVYEILQNVSLELESTKSESKKLVSEIQRLTAELQFKTSEVVRLQSRLADEDDNISGSERKLSDVNTTERATECVEDRKLCRTDGKSTQSNMEVEAVENVDQQAAVAVNEQIVINGRQQSQETTAPSDAAGLTISALRRQLADKDEEIRQLMSDMTQLYQEYLDLNKEMEARVISLTENFGKMEVELNAITSELDAERQHCVEVENQLRQKSQELAVSAERLTVRDQELADQWRLRVEAEAEILRWKNELNRERDRVIDMELRQAEWQRQVTFSGDGQEMEIEMAELRRDLDCELRRCEQLEDSLQRTSLQLTDRQKRIAELETRVSHVTRELSAAQEALIEQKNKNAFLQKQLDAEKQQSTVKDDYRESLTSQIASLRLNHEVELRQIKKDHDDELQWRTEETTRFVEQLKVVNALLHEERRNNDDINAKLTELSIRVSRDSRGVFDGDNVVKEETNRHLEQLRRQLADEVERRLVLETKLADANKRLRHQCWTSLERRQTYVVAKVASVDQQMNASQNEAELALETENFIDERRERIEAEKKLAHALSELEASCASCITDQTSTKFNRRRLNIIDASVQTEHQTVDNADLMTSMQSEIEQLKALCRQKDYLLESLLIQLAECQAVSDLLTSTLPVRQVSD